jgi:hypothetical protein
MAAPSIKPTTSLLPVPWQERAASSFRALPDFLAWKSGASMIDAATVFHETWVDKRLHRWASATESTHARDIDSLSPYHRRRIRWAPEVLALLRQTNPGEVEFNALCRFIEVEEYLNDRRSEAPPECWSALGDYSTDSAKAGSSHPPRLRDIFVDFRSPCRAKYRVLPFPVKRYSPDEEGQIMQGLEAGFSIVERSNSICVTMIESMVSSIMPIRNDTNPDSMSSASMRRYFGSMGIANLHHGISAPANVADILVHEAIHSLLYRLELFIPLHLSDEVATALRAKSPWTGSKLSVQSFAHACFVWFGLWHFWEISASLGCDDPALRKRAKNGFLIGPPSALLPKEAIDNFQPHVRSAIERMFEIVRSE